MEEKSGECVHYNFIPNMNIHRRWVSTKKKKKKRKGSCARQTRVYPHLRQEAFVPSPSQHWRSLIGNCVCVYTTSFVCPCLGLNFSHDSILNSGMSIGYPPPPPPRGNYSLMLLLEQATSLPPRPYSCPCSTKRASTCTNINKEIDKWINKTKSYSVSISKEKEQEKNIVI